MKIDTEVDLILESVGLQFRFANFRDGMGVTRRLIIEQQPKIEHNTAGVAKRLARWFEPKNSWAFSLNLSETKFEVLEYLRERQKQLIRSNGAYAIELQDKRISFIETGVQTRAASGAILSPPTTETVEYFAKFNVLLKFPANFYRRVEKDNVTEWLVNFQAVEDEKFR